MFRTHGDEYMERLIMALEEIVDICKRGILWIIVKLVFTTQELKLEAHNHVYSSAIRIPGVFYGLNLIKGYRAIGECFPGRCRMIRWDFILGYSKIFMAVILIGSLFYWLGKSLI